MFCPNCRKELPEGTKFCGGCGTPISAQQTPTAPIQPVIPVKPAAPAAAPASAPTAAPIKPVVKEKKNVDIKGTVDKVVAKASEVLKNVPKQYIKIGAIALAALIVISLLVSIIGGSKAPNYAMYVKDEEVMFNDFSSKAPYQVTEDNESSYYSGEYWLTQDGKYLFYIDNGDELYYRSATNFKKEPVKLDTGVYDFWVSENGKTVTYIKKGNLMQHDLKEAEKIVKDVYEIVCVSPDGKIIYFYDDENNLCSWYKGEVEELEEGANLVYLSEDYKTAYYVDDDEILMKKVGKDAETIAEDVYDSGRITEDGAFYYTTYPEGDLEDYFDDADDYGESGSMECLCTLYYYNGSKSKEVATNVYVQNVFGNDGSTGIVYYQFGEVEEGALSFEEMYEDYSDEDNMMVAYLTDVSGEGTLTVGINGKTSEIELEELYSLRLSPDGKELYAITEYDWETNECTLMVASVSGGKVKAFEELDSGIDVDYVRGFVNDYSTYSMGNFAVYGYDYHYSDYFVYFKDVENGMGELYVNGEMVEEDVYVDDIRYNSGKDALVFFMDVKNGEGDLMIFNGKKAELIAEDVYSYSIHENGNIAFKYDTKDGEGSLALYTGKVKEVSEDVTYFSFTADGDLIYLVDYKNGEGDLGYYDGKAEIIDEDVSSFVSFYDAN